MSSVVRQQHLVQWSSRGFAALALAAVLGCQPAAEKKITPTKPADQAPAKTTVQPAQPAPTQTPEATVPAKQPTSAEPAKEPAKQEAKEPEKDAANDVPVNKPAQEAPAPANSGDAAGSLAAEAQAVEIDPRNMEPTVVWLPKPVPNADSAAENQAGMKPYTEKITGTDVTFDMVPIAGGTFKMGSPETEKDRQDDEGPQVEVKLDPFWMGKCEVTWNEYELWGSKLEKQRRQGDHARQMTGTRSPMPWPRPPMPMAT